MTLAINKSDISDPGFYDILISDQKKKVRNDPRNPESWLELGRLQEAKVEMIRCFAEKSFAIRWIPIISIVLFVAASFGLLIVHSFFLDSLTRIVHIPLIILFGILTIYMVRLRYPHSGSRYFRKALALDSECADTYEQLGMISLRNRKSKKAFFLLEQAWKRSGAKRIERELKSIYGKELAAFFEKKSNKEKELQKAKERLHNEVTTLKSEINTIKNKNTAIIKKVHSTKAEASRIMKKSECDMAEQLDKMRQDHEKQIADLERAMEDIEEKNVTAKRNFTSLTLEVMEAKALNDKFSFEQTAKHLRNNIGITLWQSLSEQTQYCLTTAEHAFSLLDKNSVHADFSLVGMELCKALETEINKVLVEPFANSLNGYREEFLRVNQTGRKNGMPTYFTYLAKVVDDKHYPGMKSLTLGQYLFVLKKTLEGDYALDEYGNFLDTISETKGVKEWRNFLQKLRIVTNEYRNSIVHNTHMTHLQYEQLRNLIFNRRDSLLKQFEKLSTCCHLGNLYN